MTPAEVTPGARVTCVDIPGIKGTVVADDRALPLRGTYVYVRWDHWERGHLAVVPIYELRPISGDATADPDDTKEVGISDYQETLADAARQACTAYLDGTSAYGDVRYWQEYDHLDPAGQTVWRAVALKAHRRLLHAETRRDTPACTAEGVTSGRCTCKS